MVEPCFSLVMVSPFLNFLLSCVVVADATPRLQTFWSYAKVELKPPTLGEMPQVQEGFNNIIKAARTGKWKTLTVKVCVQGSLFMDPPSSI